MNFEFVVAFDAFVAVILVASLWHEIWTKIIFKMFNLQNFLYAKD